MIIINEKDRSVLMIFYQFFTVFVVYFSTFLFSIERKRYKTKKKHFCIIRVLEIQVL
jgi:hypothetical protein